MSIRFPRDSLAGRRSFLTAYSIHFCALLFWSAFACAQPAASAANFASSSTIQRSGNIQYVEINTANPDAAAEAKQLLVLVHGTPGSWSAFRSYLADPIMQARYHMIAVTRPGWINDRDSKVPSLEAQAEALEPILRRDGSGKGAILMGHSYGGPVIARAAMNYPELVSGLVFVAGTGDPRLSGPRWYNRIATILPRFILGASLKGANAEIMPLRAQLEEMLPRWRNLNMPVLIVQGDRDRLVNPGNADFLRDRMVNADITSIVLAGKGHFILWEEANLIRDAIVELF